MYKMSYSLIIKSTNRAASSASVNDATYNFDWSAFEEGKYKVSWNIYKLPVAVVTPFQTLIATKAMWGQYSAASWVSGTNTLTDLTGNGRNATTANLTSGTAAGNGATASIAYLAGTTTGTILWPAGSVPAVYTICSITRYANAAANQQRLLCSSTNYWAHGHYAGQRGITYNGAAWRTPLVNTGVVTDWLNFCATSSAANPTNILLDTNPVGLAIAGNGAASAACINLSAAGAPSDFQFSQLLIWNQELTAAELAIVAAALNTYLTTGVLQ